MIKLVSDTHFSHGQILVYEPTRQFDNYEAMDEYMISRWNEVVNPEDTLYHLGDVYIGSSKRRDYVLPQLNGNKHLLIGNHDRITKTAWAKQGFTVIPGRYFMIDPDIPIIYSHYPIENAIEDGQRLLDMGYFNVHGHVHTNISHLDQSNHLCISVELTEMGPVDYEWILAIYRDRTGKR